MKIHILMIVLLACLAISSLIENSMRVSGIDFYHYWGVSKAQELSDTRLRSPYLEHAQYLAVLNAHADRSFDKRIKAANRYRRSVLKLTQTPLLYATFAILPLDYSTAFRIYQTVQIASFLAAIIILGLLYHGHWAGVVLFAILLVLAYQPLLADLRVANFNSIQLFGFALLLVFAERVLARADHKPIGPSVAFMCALVFMTLLKPNLALVTLLLAAHLWALRGTSTFVFSSVVAVAFGLLLIVLTSLKFDSWLVWVDWYHYVKDFDFFYPSRRGNFSTVILISETVGKSPLFVTVVMTCILGVSAAAALVISVSKARSRVKDISRTAVQWLRDPHALVAVGVTVTVVLSPLVWIHYYIACLLPALWLLSAQRWWRHAPIAGGLSILLTSSVAVNIFVLLFGWAAVIPYGVAIGWVPLWIGLLAILVNGRIEKDQTDRKGIVL